MRKIWKPFLWIGLLALLMTSVTGVLALSLTQSAEEGEQIFQQKCAGCHTIGGGRLVGPDLQGVTTQRDRAWLEQFIQNPNAMFSAGDPDATALLDKYQVPMPALGLSADEVSAVIAYLETTAIAPEETTAGEQQPIGPTALYMQGDPDWGEKLFTGQVPFENGGPAGAVWDNAGPHHARQGDWRRTAGRRLRREKGNNGKSSPLRAYLSGRHAVGEPAGDVGRHRHAEDTPASRNVRTVGGKIEKTGRRTFPSR